MNRAAALAALALLSAIACRAPGPPTVPVAGDRLPDDGPKNCADDVSFHERAKPNTIGPRAGCVTDVIELDYAALPLLDPANDAPTDSDLIEAVNNYRGARDVGIDYPTTPFDRVAFRPPALRPDSLDIFYQDRGSGAVERGSGRATAVVRGLFYAFRHCRDGCDRAFGDPMRAETLVLIGPPAEWRVSSIDEVAYSDSAASKNARSRFSFASVTIKPGTSASIGLTISREGREEFNRLGGSKLPSGPLTTDNLEHLETAMLDFVWPEGRSPELRLYRGEIVEPVDPFGARRRSTRRSLSSHGSD